MADKGYSFTWYSSVHQTTQIMSGNMWFFRPVQLHQLIHKITWCCGQLVKFWYLPVSKLSMIVWVAGTMMMDPSSRPQTSRHCIGRKMVAVNAVWDARGSSSSWKKSTLSWKGTGVAAQVAEFRTFNLKYCELISLEGRLSPLGFLLKSFSTA